MGKCKLAQELVDAIIDNVKDDRWTLHRCSWPWPLRIPQYQTHQKDPGTVE
jgi:hypothetical protein